MTRSRGALGACCAPRALMTGALLSALCACQRHAERAPAAEEAPIASAQPTPAPAAAAPRPTPLHAPNTLAAPARDITVPPPNVDVHVINGRNILSAPLDEPSAKTPGGSGDPSERVRVTFWTTPDGVKLPEPQRFEGALAEIDLGLGDLPMLSPGQERRIWIPGPVGMATFDVELIAPEP